MRPDRAVARGYPQVPPCPAEGPYRPSWRDFFPTPDRNVPQSPHPGPCRHGWPIHIGDA